MIAGSDSSLFIDEGGMKKQAKPTQAESTFLLKERLVGKLTSFPTTEMGIHCIGTQPDRGPLLIWRSSESSGVALSNTCGMAP